jgi:hypothetical protein
MVTNSTEARLREPLLGSLGRLNTGSAVFDPRR